MSQLLLVWYAKYLHRYRIGKLYLLNCIYDKQVTCSEHWMPLNVEDFRQLCRRHPGSDVKYNRKELWATAGVKTCRKCGRGWTGSMRHCCLADRSVSGGESCSVLTRIPRHRSLMHFLICFYRKVNENLKNIRTCPQPSTCSMRGRLVKSHI